jgi:hypothetical protein
MFAWLVIFAGMGMGVSFMFMWATSILEMWLFKPVFIDGIGSRYVQWRDSPEPSAVDKLLTTTKAVIDYLKPVVISALTYCWAFIKDKLDKK